MTRLIVRDMAVTLGRRRIVGNISFELRRGEVIGLFGPSGSGKTTILRAISGLIRPERSDQLRWVANTGEVTSFPRPIAIVRQRESIPEWLSVERFMRMCIAHRRLPRERANPIIE